MFTLPSSTIVQKVIPKNTFDSFMNSKQKKMMSESIQRITWLNKIAVDTVNLQGNEVKEIQIFKIELKSNSGVIPLLHLMDKVVPYHIIFLLYYSDRWKVVTSIKHPHPVEEQSSVVDHAFETDWTTQEELVLKINLMKSLDYVMLDFYQQFTPQIRHADNLRNYLLEIKRQESFEKQVEKLRRGIARAKDFKKKVELNTQLNKLLTQITH
ncbi:MAG TPA: DUF4391 domain-containing protein [Taishania sp.]|nr:DUF4391 domain-containing protein [Taishania sp.]